MTEKQKLRIAIDSAMTMISIVLMGGNYFFPWDGVHEILGVCMFFLWAMHVWLNHWFYCSLFRGEYSVYRSIQTFINVAVLLCTAGLMVSGIMLSNHVFSFLNIERGMHFARVLHMLASHWYFLFMSLHIGMHFGMMGRQIHLHIWIVQLLAILCCTYGIYVFFARGIGSYLVLRQQFFFFDREKGHVLFFIDYISIVIMFAFLADIVARLIKKK